MADIKLPEEGTPKDKLLQQMEDLKSDDANWKEGRTWSLVYYAGEEINQVIKEAYMSFFHLNALNPMAFPSLRKFESEIVAMTASLLGGNNECAGSVTSGGTESILLGVKTARERARAEKPEIEQPEAIVPVTVHPAFEKAFHYLGVKPIRIPVDDGFRADVKAAREAVSENTILMVGSAPAYPHGVIDPIPELAEIAAERDISFHVDSCLGGFMLPFIRELGYPVPEFDFNVPGVTSISADLHKYGYAAKGASTIIHRNSELRKYQFFVYPDWPGGLFGSPTMTGTRPGGAIAAAWAILNYLGKNGYLELAELTMKTAERLMEGVESIPGLYILGEPDMTVFAFSADDYNIYAIGEAMEYRGWQLDRQQDPASLHLMATPTHANIVDEFIEDLKTSVEDVKAGKVKETEGMVAMYGMMGTISDRKMVNDFILDFLDQLLRV